MAGRQGGYLPLDAKRCPYTRLLPGRGLLGGPFKDGLKLRKK